MKVEPNTFNTIDIATSGLRAYGRQMKVIGSNMANIQTTDAGNGQPYRRLGRRDFRCVGPAFVLRSRRPHHTRRRAGYTNPLRRIA